ncbi:MAG: hypothetical protein ACU0DK_00980, partial [Pseudooceanicola sp.]
PPPPPRDKLAALVPETGSLRAPDPVGGNRVGTDAVLAWLAAPGPEGSRVYLQLREGGALRTQPVEGNAVRLDVGAGPGAWRVLRMDRAETRYAASPWQDLDGPGAGERPGAEASDVVIRLRRGDPRGAEIARQVAGDLAHNGFAVTVQARPAATMPARSGVNYFFDTDAGMALRLAGFVPGLSPARATGRSGAGGVPGRIVIDLVMEPAGSESAGYSVAR